MSVQLSLPEDALMKASPEVLVFLIRHLESRGVCLQTALDAQESSFNALEEKYKETLDLHLEDMYEADQRLEAAELKARALNEDVDRVIASNQRLEVENDELRYEVDAVKALLFEQQLTDH